MTDDAQRDLRLAFGQFATGVTVVTTVTNAGKAVGVTANSFSSVSLDPPMLLWSLSDSAKSKDAFVRAEYFYVHVLTESQLELSKQFASTVEDKFEGVDWVWGENSLPTLVDYVARFQCRTDSQYQIGDHVVFVGEILSHDRTGERPLVFHGGNYALADRRIRDHLQPESTEDDKLFPDRRKKR